METPQFQMRGLACARKFQASNPIKEKVRPDPDAESSLGRLQGNLVSEAFGSHAPPGEGSSKLWEPSRVSSPRVTIRWSSFQWKRQNHVVLPRKTEHLI